MTELAKRKDAIMKNLFAFGIAVLCAVGTCFAAQQGSMVNGEYVITVAAGDPDVTLNADDATALGTTVNLVKKGEGRLIVSTDLSAQNWKGAVRVEAGYFKPTVAGACGTRDAAGTRRAWRSSRARRANMPQPPT